MFIRYICGFILQIPLFGQCPKYPLSFSYNINYTKYAVRETKVALSHGGINLTHSK
jgi:hypothetical protein